MAAVSLATATAEQKLEEHSTESRRSIRLKDGGKPPLLLYGDLIGYREYARAYWSDTQRHTVDKKLRNYDELNEKP